EGRLLGVGQALEDGGAEDRDRLVGQLLGILGIEVERPVDPRLGVPLSLLALRVELQQRVATVGVLPTEGGRKLLRDVPAVAVGRRRVPIHRGHGSSPEALATRSRLSAGLQAAVNPPEAAPGPVYFRICSAR